MLWQTPSLLLLLLVNHVTAAAVVTQKGNEGNAITLPFQRPNIPNERFKRMHKRSVDSVQLTDEVTHYVIAVDIGTPPVKYNLLVDTGSANTFIASSKQYQVTSTSFDLASSFDIKLGSSEASGKLYKDSVTISPSLVIPQQIIGVASKYQGFDSVDGVLGLGPVDLSEGTSSDGNTIPTVMDNLFSQGSLPADVFALALRPSTGPSNLDGEITFGGIDDQKFTGDISYAPITQTAPASKGWGIDASVDYGAGKPLILKTTAGLVDLGTSLILLATDAFQAYQRATGGVMDSSTGLLTVTAAQFDALDSLILNIGDRVYEITPNAQIFPRNLNAQIGGASDRIYLIVGDLQSSSGSGQGFVLGKAFLERYYVVFDATNRQIGFATTAYTLANTN